MPILDYVFDCPICKKRIYVGNIRPNLNTTEIVVGKRCPKCGHEFIAQFDFVKEKVYVKEKEVKRIDVSGIH